MTVNDYQVARYMIHTHMCTDEKYKYLFYVLSFFHKISNILVYI